jgi:hypothetical protein
VKLDDVQQQAVSGILYKFKGVFKNEMGEFSRCDIDLWMQDWLEDENEKVKITLRNQVKLDNFDENTMLEGNSSSKLSMNVFLLLATIFILNLQ